MIRTFYNLNQVKTWSIIQSLSKILISEQQKRYSQLSLCSCLYFILVATGHDVFQWKVNPFFLLLKKQEHKKNDQE